MLKSYLLTAFRSLYRDKYYAFINISGLSAAIACCLILGLYVQYETSFDKHNEQQDRIYRVVNLLNTNGFIEDFAKTPQLLGPLLQRDYPAVQDFVRFQQVGSTLVRSKDTSVYWDSILFADSNVFDVFDHKIISGDTATALVDPLSIAISESFAEVYFGDSDPIGQTLSTDTSTYSVALVFADLPDSSHQKYDALLSFNRLNPVGIADLTSQRGENSLGNTSTFTYLLLPAGYNVDDFDAISRGIWDTYMDSIFEDTTHHDYYLEPLTAIHLKSTTIGDLPRGNQYFVYSLAAIGIFLLLVACINYVNLATARATRRLKEVGVRKILGSNKSQLVQQFIGESVFFVLLAMPIAFVLAELSLTLLPINALLETDISMLQLLIPSSLSLLLGLALILGIVSGLYPGLYLSSLPALSSSRGKENYSGKSKISRQGLVLVQFIISMGVITCTLLMNSQMQYLYNNSMGFERENKVVMRLRGVWDTEKLDRLKNMVLQNTSIQGVTASSSVPGGGFSISALDTEREDGTSEVRVFNFYWVGDDYLDVMGLELVAGRFFDRSVSTDDNGALILNQYAVQMMGWSDPIGKLVSGVPVVGVVRDFNYQNLSREMEPMALGYSISAENMNYVTLDIVEGSLAEALIFLEKTWLDFEQLHPFNYEIMVDRLNQLYGSEQSQMTLLGIFASLCVLISCLGLLGLTAFTTENRSKELGVRKVLGASYLNILLMLFKSTFFTLIAASIIAAGASYWLISQWLETFAYRVEISYLIFVTSTVFCVLVSLFTMTIQSWKTAHANPVHALRYE